MFPAASVSASSDSGSGRKVKPPGWWLINDGLQHGQARPEPTIRNDLRVGAQPMGRSDQGVDPCTAEVAGIREARSRRRSKCRGAVARSHPGREAEYDHRAPS